MPVLVAGSKMFDELFHQSLGVDCVGIAVEFLAEVDQPILSFDTERRIAQHFVKCNEDATPVPRLLMRPASDDAGFGILYDRERRIANLDKSASYRRGFVSPATFSTPGVH